MHCVALGSREGAADTMGPTRVEALVGKVAAENDDAETYTPTYSVPCFQP